MNAFKIKAIVPRERLILLKKKFESCASKPLKIFGALELLVNDNHPKRPKLDISQAENKKFQSFVFVRPMYANDDIQNLSVTWDPMEIDDEDVGRLFRNIPNWDWDKHFLIQTHSDDQRTRFNELFKNTSLITSKSSEMECAMDVRSIVLTLDYEDIQPIKLPPEYKVGPLPPSAATMLHSTWNFKIGESAKEISERLESSLKGVGVFHTKNENEILSMAQQYVVGEIGMGYTLPEYRKKGLAKAVAMTLAKQILDEGRTAFLEVDDDNHRSLQVALKNGFKVHGTTGWSAFTPLGSPWVKIFNYKK